MPRMSGPELVGKLQALHPQLKVIYMSGYTDSAIVHHGVRGSGTWFLSKPFAAHVLLAKVREALGAPTAAAV